VGSRAIAVADSIVDVSGMSQAVLPHDSVTFLILLSPECDECRLDVPAYGTFAKWAEIQGAAVRIVLPDDSPATVEFSGLIDRTVTVLRAPRPWYFRAATQEVLTVMLLDSSGVLVARWTGSIPSHLASLNVMDGARRFGASGDMAPPHSIRRAMGLRWYPR
jgi:hypothetical protein